MKNLKTILVVLFAFSLSSSGFSQQKPPAQRKYQTVKPKIIKPHKSVKVIKSVKPEFAKKVSVKNTNVLNKPLLKFVRPEAFKALPVLKKNVVLPGFTNRQQVSYVVMNNLAMHEGDIILGSARNVVDPAPEPHPVKKNFGTVGGRTDGLTAIARNGRVNPDYLWFYGIMPYKINAGFTAGELATIRTAIQQLNARTNLNLIPYSGQHNFIEFIKKTDMVAAGSSPVGRQRNSQHLNLNTNPPPRTVIHELLHAAGVWHEQSRKDRDRYIRVLPANIVDGLAYNFDKHTADGHKVTPYDRNSIMHYGGFAFGKSDGRGGTLPTIVDARSGVPVSSSSTLSAMDIDGINTLYPIDYVDFVTPPFTTIRFVKTTILRVRSNDRDGGGKTAIDFYMKNETGPGWDWRPGGRSNPTERFKSGTVEEGDNDISPNWTFRYTIPRNERYAKVWLKLRDDDGRSGTEGGISPDENVDIHPLPGISEVELFINTINGRIYLSDLDGAQRDENYMGQLGEELELQGNEGQIKGKITFKIELED